MKSVYFKRMFRNGFLNFTRNSLVSLASILVMTITLSVLSGVILFEHVLKTTLASVEQKVDITAYFVPGTDEDIILGIKDKVAALPVVASTEYVSEKDALAAFRDRHANDTTTLQALNELSSNPIGAMVNIKAKDISQYESISNFFQQEGTVDTGAQSVIDHVDYSSNKDEIAAIQSLLHKGKNLGWLVIIVLMALTVIITFNTIRLAIYFAREEIGVMRLVGASRSHVQGPFIVEGAVYGFLATLITLILFIPITLWFGKHMTDFFQGLNLFTYFIHNLLFFAGVLLVSGMGLGALSSVLATNRYLKI